ncbi:MAG: ferritin family protein [Candidatus Muirbacterium halophilum]|nr:ferritin family protein [Candidatus Muirbacterium halophilum]MCK9474837.1 ferritin family protein [Candidatus Muirbacterium halophilum]
MKYNAYEIIEMAKKMERNAALFYEKASQQVENQKVKNLLSDLAKMEKVHEVVFDDLKNLFSDAEWANMNISSDNEMLRYLESMADVIVFNWKMDEKEIGNMSDIDYVFRFAIGKEKESVLYYMGIKQLVPETLGKDKIEEIIKEEMKHVAILSDVWKQYSKKSN